MSESPRRTDGAEPATSARPADDTGGTRLDPYVTAYAARAHGMTASEIRALFAVASRPEIVSLAGGMPNLSALPLDVVGELFAEVARDQGSRSLQYSTAQGDPRLRELIGEVMAEEGIAASPEDVSITVGSQQGLDLVSRIFCDPGDVVLAEAPSYVGALGVFASYQAEVVHVAMDEDGLVPEALAETIDALGRDGRHPKLLYTVPNFHNPAGVTLSEQRRARILEIAESAGILVVEDNPYGLLGFDADPLPALRAIDDGVIYLGTFSKTFAPGLRVGWVLAPMAVRAKLVLANEAATLCPPTFSQLAVATYLANHPWRDQIKAFREMYRERRDTMLSSLDGMMPPGASWTRPGGGFYVWLTLPEGLDAKTMQPRALANRVAYVPGIGFYADGQGGRDLRLSYCYPEPERIREGVRRLAAACEQEAELVATFGPGAPAAPSSYPRGDTPGPELS
jgi:DNA-binding transcriptional MocR family regulator